MAMSSIFSPDIFIKYITKSYVLLFLFFIIILTLQFSCSVGNVSSGSGLVNVDVIVLDEVHYLSDISRGTVWEEIVSMIYCLSCITVFAHDLACLISLKFVCICFVLLQVIYCPKAVQLICLSATVANPDELAGWIGQVFRLGWSCLLQLQNLLRIEHLSM